MTTGASNDERTCADCSHVRVCRIRQPLQAAAVGLSGEGFEAHQRAAVQARIDSALASSCPSYDKAQPSAT